MQLELVKSSQTAKILKLLKSTKGGVTNYDLSRISLKYSSRISELRREGYNIWCERVYRDGKASGTYLYYIKEEL